MVEVKESYTIGSIVDFSLSGREIRKLIEDYLEMKKKVEYYEEKYGKA